MGDIVLSLEQQKFSDGFSYALSNAGIKKDKTTIHAASSAPGSGKTTTLKESIINFVEAYPHIVDDMLDKDEKILILVFNNKNKKELEKTFTKAQLPMDLFEISTSHSFFKRSAESIKNYAGKRGKGSTLGNFDVDYKRSTFTHRMVSYVLASLCKGFHLQNNEIESVLGKKRFLDASFLNEKNTAVAWSLINGYFSSTHSFNNIEGIEKAGEFYGKKAVSVNDFLFNEDDLSHLEMLTSKLDSDIDPRAFFLKTLIGRVVQLASTQESRIEKANKYSTNFIPVIIEGENGEEITHNTVLKHHNIFKVPHSYYYRIFFNITQGDPVIVKDIFKKYRTMGIDEYQDLSNTFQKSAVEAVLQSGVVQDIFAIGDGDQSIYGFSSPDHLDSLTYVLNNQHELDRKGIEVKQYNFNQTYRFGEQCASFMEHFYNADIIGNKNVDDFVSPDAVKLSEMPELLSTLSLKGSTAIVCRTNQEAAHIFMELRKGGFDRVKLESSIRDELTSFVKKGLLNFDDAYFRKKLYNALEVAYGSRDEDGFTYKDILNCYECKKHLIDGGYAGLTKFEIPDIERYIITANYKRTEIVWIMTAHLSKGLEFDNVLFGPDFFLREFGGKSFEETAYEDIREEKGEDYLLAALMKGAGEEAVEPNTPETQEKETRVLSNQFQEVFDILNHSKDKDDRGIGFVSMTRAKQGLWFMESPTASALLANYPLDIELNRSRAQEMARSSNPAIEMMKSAEEETLSSKHLFS